ncbi:MAG TPA: zinc-dependent metalloprotease family protein [Candidatus Thermoplasmatota archaeon]|nr:zinc-dependent metalloprotease family protein [Candidatus Thermoplasmatota archaeon]
MRVLPLALLAALAVVTAGCLNAAVAPPILEEEAAPDLPSDLAPFAPAVELRALAREAAATGATVKIPATAVVETFPLSTGTGRALDLPVKLRPSPLLSNATWAEVDGVRVAMPAIEVYEGEVENRPGWKVRLTTTDQWTRGVVLAPRFNVLGMTPAGGVIPYLVRIGLEGNVPYGTELPSDKPGAGPTVRTGPDGAWMFDAPNWPQQDCLELVPPHVAPVLERPATQKAITAKIVLDGDARFGEALGNHSFPMMIAMLNEVDPIYEQEVGIRFSLVGAHLNTDPDYYPDPKKEAPLTKAAEYWNGRKDVDRDVVHVFTGYPSNYAMANCIGGAGIPDIGYTFTPLGWEIDSVYFHTSAFAHELGHIFSAHHHYGNHVETDGGLATIMIQGYTPGFRPVFSTLSKTVIRGWAEQYIKD